jgi:LmbE family N-acetylglucosaminyl deacetylase
MKTRKFATAALMNMLAPSPRSLRGLLHAAASFHDVNIDWTPGNERVIVLAPHMDDEVLGCGGTIALHHRAGAHVTVVFLTDGRQGSSALAGLHGARLQEAQDELVRVRKAEAQNARAALGVDELVFLDASDGALAADAEAPGRLRTIIEKIKPQIVYLPSHLEQHPDHRAANDVLLAAIEGSTIEFACHAYEVWLPLYPNCMVGIDSVIDTKRQALAHYRSQLAEADFEHGIMGLNAYRAMMRPRLGRRYAEAFVALPRDEYASMYRQYLT